MSLTEILLILAVVLLVVGPERIPALARKLGSALRELRRASNFFRDAFMLEDELPSAGDGADLDIVDQSHSSARSSSGSNPPAPSTDEPTDAPGPEIEFGWFDLPPTQGTADQRAVELPPSTHSDLVRSRPLPYPLITY